MGSSGIGPGTLSEWYRHSVTVMNRYLDWTPLGSAQKQRCTCEVLEECSPELMVSHKLRSLMGSKGSKWNQGFGGSKVMGRFLPSREHPCPLIAVLTPDAGPFT